MISEVNIYVMDIVWILYDVYDGIHDFVKLL